MAMKNPASRLRRNQESWPQEKQALELSQEELPRTGEISRAGEMSRAGELPVRALPEQTVPRARTWQPEREVWEHPDYRGQTSPWRP